MDWSFHHIFSNSGKQQFITSVQRTANPTLINTVSVWQRGNKNDTNDGREKTLFVVLRLQSFSLEHYMPRYSTELMVLTLSFGKGFLQGSAAVLVITPIQTSLWATEQHSHTILGHWEVYWDQEILEAELEGPALAQRSLAGPLIQLLGVPGPMVMITFLDCSHILK